MVFLYDISCLHSPLQSCNCSGFWHRVVVPLINVSRSVFNCKLDLYLSLAVVTYLCQVMPPNAKSFSNVLCGFVFSSAV